MWTARRILKDLADADRRRRIAAAFWKHADASSKAMAAVQLARSLHFRDETIRKMPADKKAELLASRAALPELEQTLEAALMHYHTHEQNEMLGAFLDAWRIPHVNGSIETDDYTPPTAEQVRDAVRELRGRFDARDVAIYLATLGLLMGEPWDGAAWPAIDDAMPTSA
ncbi:MAG TPA: hypothetical protein VEO74_05550 [Thermoanaerobaculia bacterium]|nr:hypothetical protein [Thermoanaerobaculia bacterium]